MTWLLEHHMDTTLWIASMIYVLPLKHRNHFRIRLVITFLMGWTFSFLILLLKKNGLESDMLILASYYSVTVILLLFCGNISINSALYCAVWAIISQKMIYETWMILYRIACDAGMIHESMQGFSAVMFFTICYLLCAFTLARWMPEKGQYRIGPKQLTSAIMLLIAFELLFNLLFSGKQYILADNSTWMIIVLVQIYCITVIYLQNELFKKSSLRHELMTLNLLWHQQKTQYSLSKENIALINRKCHDLKHQINAIRDMVSVEEREKYLVEMEESIQIYEAIVKTGNEVLDTILTEKSLFCKEKNIQIHCVADGSQLEFMDPVDLYTIFGNAIDNAIECVQQFTDKEKRQIDVLVYLQQQFLVIQIINPMTEKPTFEDDLPISTKSNNGYHGFGLKSIRHTVEKYEGCLSVSVEDGCFFLKILITVPVKNK